MADDRPVYGCVCLIDWMRSSGAGQKTAHTGQRILCVVPIKSEAAVVGSVYVVCCMYVPIDRLEVMDTKRLRGIFLLATGLDLCSVVIRDRDGY